jgi:hypothetical protein
MKSGPFSVGERVRVLTGKYTGLSGSVFDPAEDSRLLPAPRPSYYWIKSSFITSPSRCMSMKAIFGESSRCLAIAAFKKNVANFVPIEMHLAQRRASLCNSSPLDVRKAPTADGGVSARNEVAVLVLFNLGAVSVTRGRYEETLESKWDGVRGRSFLLMSPSRVRRLGWF